MSISETVREFVKGSKEFPTIPVGLVSCALGAAYLARQGVRLCLPAALTIEKVKAAACILGSLYIVFGIILVTKVLLIRPNDDVRQQLRETGSPMMRFICTHMNVVMFPIILCKNRFNPDPDA